MFTGFLPDEGIIGFFRENRTVIKRRHGTGVSSVTTDFDTGSQSWNQEERYTGTTELRAPMCKKTKMTPKTNLAAPATSKAPKSPSPKEQPSKQELMNLPLENLSQWVRMNLGQSMKDSKTFFTMMTIIFDLEEDDDRPIFYPVSSVILMIKLFLIPKTKLAQV